MVNLPENIKQFLRLARKNYLLTAAALCVVFVGAVSAYKMFVVKPTYLYATVRVGQGFWWASTQRPSPWFISAIRQAKDEKNPVGKPNAQILDVIYYPWYGSGQYEVIVTARLKVTKSGTNGYSYDRTPIGIGSPIDLEFSNVQFSGTIMSLNKKPMDNPYVEKTIVMTKKGAFPWEADAIQVGDSYSNGETTVLRILDKQIVDTYSSSSDQYGNTVSEGKKYVTVTVMLKGKMENDQFVYFGDQVVMPGKAISVATSNFVFNDFTIAKVE